MHITKLPITMPKNEFVERRDTTVLNLLNEIKNEQLAQGKELATNTAETRGLKEEITKLNGKVVGHETRLQSLESDKAVNNKIEEQREKKEEGQSDTFRRWTDRLLWGLFVLFLLFVFAIAVRSGVVTDFLHPTQQTTIK